MIALSSELLSSLDNVFYFTITDDTEKVLLNATKHITEAKRHSSISYGRTRYFKEIKASNGKTNENINNVSYPQIGVSILSQRHIFGANM
jgi:hypothetical protein